MVSTELNTVDIGIKITQCSSQLRLDNVKIFSSDSLHKSSLGNSHYEIFMDTMLFTQIIETKLQNIHEVYANFM